jgi:hypothetical protein
MGRCVVHAVAEAQQNVKLRAVAKLTHVICPEKLNVEDKSLGKLYP